MRTVKEVSDITGISIRTLRYYDEIGLLKPAQLTETGYRLYDNEALAKLQEIMFFKELDVSLKDIKAIMENPDYDREQVLLTQKNLLERKRNRLNGIIELIDDRISGGVGTMNFEVFDDKEIKKILDHSLELQSEEAKAAIIQKYGSIDAFRKSATEELKDEKKNAQIIKIYGSKDKAVCASLQADGSRDKMIQFQTEVDEIYRQFAEAMKMDNSDKEKELVSRLAESYKRMFCLDNARYMLLEIAKEYLSQGALAEATNKQYGEGCAEYIGGAVSRFYGV